ncbi:MAG: hypothetical protein ACRCYU_19015 [Nocardioides sp.]
MDWTPVIVAAVPTIGVAGTVLVTMRDFSLRRDLEISRQFAAFVSVAHGRAIDGREVVGMGEQLAHVQLVVWLARRHRRLRPAAIAALQYLSREPKDDDRALVLAAARDGLSTLLPADASKRLSAPGDMPG